MQRRGKNRYKFGIKQIIINHISENINIYFKVAVIFIIGICIGIIMVNQLPETELANINGYIGNSINAIKINSEIPKTEILKSSLCKNIVIVLTIWFLGLTLIGSFVLYFVILIIGITFGYTISAIMTSFTFTQGILFFFTQMLLQNLITIPAIIFLIVQGIKLHKNIAQKQNTNPKYIVVKFSFLAIFVFVLLIIASLIEAYISTNLINYIIKYL